MSKTLASRLRGLPNSILHREPQTLSDLVVQERAQILSSKHLHHQPRRRFSVFRFVPLPILVAIIVAAIVWSATIGAFSHMVPLLHVGPDQEIRIENAIATSAQVLAAITGLVLPLVILFVEFYGRTVSSVIRTYLKGTGLFLVMFWSLLVTALDILTLATAHLGLISTVQVATGLLFALVALTVGVIFDVWLVVRKTVNVASVETLSEILKNTLDESILQSFDEELDYRLRRRLFIQILDRLRVKRILPIPPLPNQMVAIVSTGQGIFRDVNLSEFERFVEMARQTAADGKERLPVLFNKLPGDLVRRGESLVYVSSLVDSKEIQRKLQHCLILGRDIERTEDPRLFLDQLKDLTISAAEQHIESQFESLFDLYARALELNAEFVEPPPASDWDFIREWWVITLVGIALHDVLRVASKSGFAAHCCYGLYVAASHAVSRRNAKAFELVVSFFETIYLYARQATDEAGVYHSFNYLSRDLIDDILGVGHSVTAYALDRTSQTGTLLGSVFRVLFNILYQTVKDRDLPTYQRLWKRLQEPELFAHYPLLRGSLINRQVALKSQLRIDSSTNINNADVASELQFIDQLLLLPQDTQKALMQGRMVVGGYLLRSYAEGTLTIELFQQFLKPLEPSFSNIHVLAAVLEQAFKMPAHRGFWSRFQGLPDTRQVISFDPMFDQLRCYCVIGIRLLAQREDSSHIPEVEFVGHHLDRIKQICEDIQQNATMWKPFLLLDDLGAIVGQFLEFNREIARHWQHLQEDQVIASPLTVDRINEYTRALLEAWSSQAEIRSLLPESRIEIVDRLQGRGQLARIYALFDKAAFVTKQENGLAHEMGHLDGSRLAHYESNWIVEGLASKAPVLPTKKGWSSLQPYFELGLKRLQEKGFEPDIILIPWGCDYRLLVSLPEFVPQHARQHQFKLSGLHGFYKDIPVVSWKMPPHVLIVDLKTACELWIQRPAIHVRMPIEQEIAKLKERNPELDDRKLALSVVRLADGKLSLRSVESKALAKLSLKSGIHCTPLSDPHV